MATVTSVVNKLALDAAITGLRRQLNRLEPGDPGCNSNQGLPFIVNLGENNGEKVIYVGVPYVDDLDTPPNTFVTPDYPSDVFKVYALARGSY